MKIEQAEQNTFKPVTITLETSAELEMMIEAMDIAYEDATYQSELEIFADECGDTLRDRRGF